MALPFVDSSRSAFMGDLLNCVAAVYGSLRNKTQIAVPLGCSLPLVDCDVVALAVS